MYLVGLPRFRTHASLRGAIAGLGLTSNLKLSLDVGDVTSYPGSGQPWLDLSGNGYDFNRGTNSSSTASDPTYNGTAGQRSSSEYWSFDGGDFFSYDSANESWMDNLQHNDTQWSACCWAYLSVVNDYNGLMGTSLDDTNAKGVSWKASNASSRTSFVVLNGTGGGSGVSISVETTSVLPTAGVWQFYSLSVDEVAGTVTFGLDGAYEVKTSQFFSVSGAAGYGMAIGNVGNSAADTARAFKSGSRMAMFGMWEGVALTQANMTAIRNATKGRFGF